CGARASAALYLGACARPRHYYGGDVRSWHRTSREPTPGGKCSSNNPSGGNRRGCGCPSRGWGDSVGRRASWTDLRGGAGHHRQRPALLLARSADEGGALQLALGASLPLLAVVRARLA